MMPRVSKSPLISSANRRVVFQQPYSVSDGGGGFSIESLNYIRRWASVEPIKAIQVAEYRGLNVEATHHFKTRGHLVTPTNFYKQGATWPVEWNSDLLDSSNVKIYYKIGDGDIVGISESEENTGSYSWTIPEEAIGESVVVRVVNHDDTTEYIDSGCYLIVDSRIEDREVIESDRILFDSRSFEILTIEDLREKEFCKFITCKELRD